VPTVAAASPANAFQFHYQKGQFLPGYLGSRTLERSLDASWAPSGTASGSVTRSSTWRFPMSEGGGVTYRTKTTPLVKEARPDALAALRAAVEGAAIVRMDVSDQTKRDLGVTVHWQHTPGTWSKGVAADQLTPALRAVYDAALAIAL
jgi:hypothetical protein